MRILIAHNTYQNSGGEDVVAATESQILLDHGHEVIWYRRDNSAIDAKHKWDIAATGIGAVWSHDSYHSVADLIRSERPDVAHFHNTFPLISPSAYHSCAQAGVPVVQTLHNYRLLCPAATLFRDGHVCEQCLRGRFFLSGIIHRCYRGGALATSAVASMLTVHRALSTWQKKIDRYIAVSHFARQKFIEGGLAAERICVKPNCIHPDPGAKSGSGKYAIFIGRLSEEKGVRVLLDAWRVLACPVPLLVVGDGPLADEVCAVAERETARITAVGPLRNDDARALLKQARFLIFPSLLYEGALPLVILEAFACGVPVIASRIGSMKEGIVHGQNGFYFEPGNSLQLADLCAWSWGHPEQLQKMGRAARREYEAKYTPEENYERLMEIYRASIASRCGARV